MRQTAIFLDLTLDLNSEFRHGNRKQLSCLVPEEVCPSFILWPAGARVGGRGGHFRMSVLASAPVSECGTYVPTALTSTTAQREILQSPPSNPLIRSVLLLSAGIFLPLPDWIQKIRHISCRVLHHLDFFEPGWGQVTGRKIT